MNESAEQPVENSIVTGFQNLQVLTAYDFQRMDELVNDLTNALDESTRNRKGERSASEQSRASGSKSKLVRRKKCKKRKSLNQASGNWQQGNISEASESSLDEAIKDYIETIAQQSDSDDLVLNAQRLKSLSSLPNQVLSFAESDSVTENISPMRPQRRRRRQFKRMAVDPPASNPLGEQQNLESSEHLPSDAMEIREHSLPGKRKRSMKEKNNSFDNGQPETTSSKSSDAKEAMEVNATETTGSSLSSSESSDGLFTNDESREGDDEQSDFFHEIGPACGSPGIIPWWQADLDDPLQLGLPPVRDPTFESILSGSFEYLSEASKNSFKARLKMLAKPGGRVFRAGRRRLKDRRQSHPLSSLMVGGQPKWSVPYESMQKSGSNGNATSDHIKRRKKTPPVTPTEELQHTECVGAMADPIPVSNVGSRLLQAMGWTPGEGLGPTGEGITDPVSAVKRRHRTGLGYNCDKNT
ncbi:hypothetical protein CAPTEDRAFT_219858 [Capitella teleta]|uniref:G-patch domain-containing protein n=1 Tax=Capitella teleta TaxID=283909 RepID=R7TYT2_CAPTE|nr:hypothetical protein CAPTEDRAFT_219858 [Capitella teleta]|eukprot:ELT96581.1 hypothetical protein CAPTEDRAFT_219858 [Capitella teleta]